jgi:hypothetical protein
MDTDRNISDYHFQRWRRSSLCVCVIISEFLTKYYSGDKIKEDEVHVVFGTYDRGEKGWRSLVRKREG